MNEAEIEEYIERSQFIIESSPQMDEQNTRRKLVEPFIELLGWDIVSPDVELEYSVQMGSGTKKVDYALLLEETPVVFVEAKGCDSSVSESNRRQLKSYMRQTGVDWGLLTNGTRSELFKRRTGGPRPDETSLGAFSLDELVEYHNVLRAISRESIESGEAQNIAEHIEAAHQAAETLQDNKEKLAEEITQLLFKEVGESVSQTIEGETKQYLDSLVAALRERRKVEVSDSSSSSSTTSNPSQQQFEGKYGPLYERLVNSSSEARFTFEEINSLLDSSLPPSAYEHRAWWRPHGHSHAQGWVDLGWEIDTLDLDSELVVYIETAD